jgi:glycosyltransferase involved in cell wall biosynthesis
VPQKQTPLITTIIPTFRRPALLSRAIKSVLDQSCPQFEVLVCDNNSGDETQEVVAELTGKDDRVTYHCHRENIGFVRNFNFGLSQIKTPYFNLLSDDDLLLPHFFEMAVRALEVNPLAAVFVG